jgi:hypothetical protein
MWATCSASREWGCRFNSGVGPTEARTLTGATESRLCRRPSGSVTVTGHPFRQRKKSNTLGEQKTKHTCLFPDAALVQRLDSASAPHNQTLPHGGEHRPYGTRQPCGILQWHPGDESLRNPCFVSRLIASHLRWQSDSTIACFDGVRSPPSDQSAEIEHPAPPPSIVKRVHS